MVESGQQLLSLAILGIPVATVTWTVTHEEVLREVREWCTHKSKTCKRGYQRKLFYLFTCEYCFSHYIGATFSGFNAISTVVTRLAGIFPCVADFGVASQHLHELVRPATAGYPP
jgi:hypothetical protein